jgi:hypothetical protein
MPLAHILLSDAVESPATPTPRLVSTPALRLQFAAIPAKMNLQLNPYTSEATAPYPKAHPHPLLPSLIPPQQPQPTRERGQQIVECLLLPPEAARGAGVTPRKALKNNWDANRAVAGITKTLQLQEDNPLFRQERNRRFYELYTYVPSNPETPSNTLAPNPNIDHICKDVNRQHKLALPRYCAKTRPEAQFRAQYKRELDKLAHQAQAHAKGRNLTLRDDFKAGRHASAQKNIIERWVEQGIWKEEWDPTGLILPEQWDYPEAMKESFWTHEGNPNKEPVERKKKKKTKARRRKQWDKKKNRRTPPAQLPHNDEIGPPEDAARPYWQFMYQWCHERQWVLDEVRFADWDMPQDIDYLAYRAIKNYWTEDGIWNGKWGAFPGMTWLNEETTGDEKLPHDNGKPVSYMIDHIREIHDKTAEQAGAAPCQLLQHQPDEVVNNIPGPLSNEAYTPTQDQAATSRPNEQSVPYSLLDEAIIQLGHLVGPPLQPPQFVSWRTPLSPKLLTGAQSLLNASSSSEREHEGSPAKTRKRKTGCDTLEAGVAQAFQIATPRRAASDHAVETDSRPAKRAKSSIKEAAVAHSGALGAATADIAAEAVSSLVIESD